MPEWRTADQIDADEKLHLAIDNVLRAYDPELLEGYVLTQYVVLTARMGISDNAADRTLYDYTLANGSIPWHAMMGLMDWGFLAMKEKMRRAERGEDE